MEKYKRAKFLLEKLLKIIEQEGKGEIDFQINEVKRGIYLLDSLLQNSDENNSLGLDLKRVIRNLYPPRGGLSDFYIWNDDEDTRIKVNMPLSNIEDELWKILS